MERTITITLKTNEKVTITEPRDIRTELSISTGGYVTVYRGTECVYKNALSDIKNICVWTPQGILVAYKHWRSRKA